NQRVAQLFDDPLAGVAEERLQQLQHRPLPTSAPLHASIGLVTNILSIIIHPARRSAAGGYRGGRPSLRAKDSAVSSWSIRTRSRRYGRLPGDTNPGRSVTAPRSPRSSRIRSTPALYRPAGYAK